jgi:hypothetical protein
VGLINNGGIEGFDTQSWCKKKDLIHNNGKEGFTCSRMDSKARFWSSANINLLTLALSSVGGFNIDVDHRDSCVSVLVCVGVEVCECVSVYESTSCNHPHPPPTHLPIYTPTHLPPTHMHTYPPTYPSTHQLTNPPTYTTQYIHTYTQIHNTYTHIPAVSAMMAGAESSTLSMQSMFTTQICRSSTRSTTSGVWNVLEGVGVVYESESKFPISGYFMGVCVLSLLG